jgi:hypothetical protein
MVDDNWQKYPIQVDRLACHGHNYIKLYSSNADEKVYFALRRYNSIGPD